jgi:hypothetical protein
MRRLLAHYFCLPVCLRAAVCSTTASRQARAAGCLSPASGDLNSPGQARTFIIAARAGQVLAFVTCVDFMLILIVTVVTPVIIATLCAANR